MTNMDAPVIVGIGEALFDRIEGGAVHLGGAPLNFAIHARQVLTHAVGSEGRVALVSRIGRDDLGVRAVTELDAFGLDLSGVQWDELHPTGTVDVRINGNGPSYRITPDVAWDFMEADDQTDELASRYDAVCFGTLARRGPRSAETIERFISSGASRGAARMYDVNLRDGATSPSMIRRGLELCSIAKMNDDELPIIAQIAAAHAPDEPSQARGILENFDLDQVVVTRGARGVAVATPDGWVEGAPSDARQNGASDAVGAGDACGAAYLVRTLLGDSPAQAATIANAVGAFVVSQPGATPWIPAEVLEIQTARIGIARKSVASSKA